MVFCFILPETSPREQDQSLVVGVLVHLHSLAVVDNHHLEGSLFVLVEGNLGVHNFGVHSLVVDAQAVDCSLPFVDCILPFVDCIHNLD